MGKKRYTLAKNSSLGAVGIGTGAGAGNTAVVAAPQSNRAIGQARMSLIIPEKSDIWAKNYG